MGDDLKEILESALHRRCTLTEGDWLRIPGGPDGRLWDVRVKELLPAAQVNIVDTDLEAQLDPSVETEERIAAEQAAAHRQLLAAQALRAEAEDAAARTQAAAALAAAEAAAQAAAQQRRRAQALAVLPPEPADTAAEVVTCAVRLPDGTRCTRRFAASDPLSHVFAFVDAHADAGGYALVTAFPRAVFGRQRAHELLGDVFGLPGGGQVALMVEAQ